MIRVQRDEGQSSDEFMRQVLIRTWLEPWQNAHSAWRNSQTWPSWALWLLERHPQQMSLMYAEWCHAFGQSLEAPPAAWLDTVQPLSPDWRGLAGLTVLSEPALQDALHLCGAVSWFNRPNAGVRWLEQQTQQDDEKSAVDLERLRIAWRMARLLRVSTDGTDTMNIWQTEACVAQGVRMLLSACNTLWGDAWAVLWPHWRWRLAPQWLTLAQVNVHDLRAPATSVDPTGFHRLWAQATVRGITV